MKNGQLEATSEELIENGQGVSYDEVIETRLEGRVEYINGEIFQYNEPEIIQEETPEQFRQKKIGQFIACENVEEFDWEGVELSGDDFNNLILLRNFENDQGAQVARLAKKDIKDLAFYIMVLGVDKKVVNQFYADDIAKARELSDTRVALGLSPLDLSFLD